MACLANPSSSISATGHPALTIPVEPAIRRHLGMGCRAHSWQGNGRSLGVVGFTVPMGAGEQSPTPKTLLKRCARARSKRVDGVTERFPKVSRVPAAKGQRSQSVGWSRCVRHHLALIANHPHAPSSDAGSRARQGWAGRSYRHGSNVLDDARRSSSTAGRIPARRNAGRGR